MNLRGNDYLQKVIDDEETLADHRGNLIIINREIPATAIWTVGISPSSIEMPIAVNVMALHRRKVKHPPPVPPSPPPTWKWRRCKIGTKALAAAIVAAAALPAVPAALIAAVAAYLGVAKVIAAAFIGSVVGSSVDVIAKKLCKRAGFC